MSEETGDAEESSEITERTRVPLSVIFTLAGAVAGLVTLGIGTGNRIAGLEYRDQTLEVKVVQLTAEVELLKAAKTQDAIDKAIATERMSRIMSAVEGLQKSFDRFTRDPRRERETR